MSEIVVQIEHANIYQSGSLILQDVNLNVQKGEFVYLVGKTGTGKSSLLKTLYGELTLTEGVGHVVGFNLKEMDWKKLPFLRRNLGVVFQDFQLLFDRNVAENLFFVLNATGWENQDEKAARAEEVLSLVGLSTKLHKMPYELSGGEQQRLSIARALLNKPEVILADEPTGNLDPKTSDDILNLLHQLSTDGNTVLMATHDYRLIEKFPAKVIKCEQGHVI